MGLRQKIKGKVIKRLEKEAAKIVEKTVSGVLDKERIGVLADALRKAIPLVGAPEMKRRVIIGVTDEWKEMKGKNSSITLDELTKEYLDEPKAMALFKDLGISEGDLRQMAQEVIDG